MRLPVRLRLSAPCPHRLKARTPGSQPENPGSTPGGDASYNLSEWPGLTAQSSRPVRSSFDTSPWPNWIKASASEAGDCGFESRRGRQITEPTDIRWVHLRLGTVSARDTQSNLPESEKHSLDIIIKRGKGVDPFTRVCIPKFFSGEFPSSGVHVQPIRTCRNDHLPFS